MRLLSQVCEAQQKAQECWVYFSKVSSRASALSRGVKEEFYSLKAADSVRKESKGGKQLHL